METLSSPDLQTTNKLSSLSDSSILVLGGGLGDGWPACSLTVCCSSRLGHQGASCSRSCLSQPLPELPAFSLGSLAVSLGSHVFVCLFVFNCCPFREKEGMKKGLP